MRFPISVNGSPPTPANTSSLYPSLTTIAIDKEQIGSNAMDMLMDLINGKTPESVIVTSNNIVVRESVRAI